MRISAASSEISVWKKVRRDLGTSAGQSFKDEMPVVKQPRKKAGKRSKKVTTKQTITTTKQKNTKKQPKKKTNSRAPDKVLPVNAGTY